MHKLWAGLDALKRKGVISVFLSAALLTNCLTEAFTTPCSQQLIGSECLFDEECYGINTICRDRRCVCPTGFEQFDLDAKTAVCRPAPDRIGAVCQRDCKPPLLCRDGKCECWGGEVTNGKCTVPCPAGQQVYGVECMRVSHLRGQCDKDAECVDPFTECINRRCSCTGGAQRDNSGRCTAACPDGTRPNQSCRRLFVNDIDMLDNAASTDSCPVGHRCVTYGSPLTGHCCPLRCPFGEADNRQRCDSGVPPANQCRSLTHYCHTVTEPAWKASICCPKPCRDPTPLFVDGKCLAVGHRGDPCQKNEQCEGGVNMACLVGTCACKLGYVEKDDDRFPTCAKLCGVDEVSVADKCFPKKNLNERCIRSKQCPNFAECRFGMCQCLCGYKVDSFLGARCTNPEDPLSLNRILSGVERIFGRGSGDGRIGRL